MTIFQSILLGFLVVCAISVSFSRNLLNSILIYMSYSLIMSILWVCLESPDLAITEAAVGAGVTSILFFATLKKIQAIRIESEKAETVAARNNDTTAQDNQEANSPTALSVSESSTQTATGIMNDSAEDRKAEPTHE
ncbi:MAG: DUF4040 domain-containing protein [Lachnospiraceae bacterium]|nr:DUF4040 domain-containing protein [Lachnospiraceae bacterium]